MIIPGFVYDIAAKVYLDRIRKLEKKLGYKIILDLDSDKWIKGTMVFDMTPAWKNTKMKTQGINYYTMGKIENELSTRFDYKTDLYQGWLGGYLIQVPNGEWTTRDHVELADADQINWLKMYGDLNPCCDIKNTTPKDLGEVEISGFKGRLYESGSWSHSDVGTNGRNFYCQILMSVAARIFNISNYKLRLKGNNFLPKWDKSQNIDSYQKVYLQGYLVIVDIEKTIKAVLYTNTANLTDKTGAEYKHFSKIKNVLKQNLLATKIVRI